MTGDLTESAERSKQKIFQSSLRDYLEKLGPTGLSYFLSEVDPENFEESLRGLITRYPEVPTIRVIYAKHLMETGKPAAAIEQLRKALKKDNNIVEARLFLVQCLAMIGQYDQATEFCRAFLGQDPEDPYANLYMGMLSDRMLHPDDSDHLRKATELAVKEKDSDEVFENFAAFAGAIGFSTHEQWVYRRWSEASPENVTPLNQLGLIMESNGNLDECIAIYEKSLEVEPKNPWIHLSLAEALLRKGEKEEALRVCSNCLEVISEEPCEENRAALKEIASFMKGLK